MTTTEQRLRPLRCATLLPLSTLLRLHTLFLFPPSTSLLSSLSSRRTSFVYAVFLGSTLDNLSRFCSWCSPSVVV